MKLLKEEISKMIIGRTLSKIVSIAQDFYDNVTLGRGKKVLLRRLQDFVMPIRVIYRNVDKERIVNYPAPWSFFGSQGPDVDMHDGNIRCSLSKAFESRRKREIDRREGIPLEEYLNSNMGAGYSSPLMFGEDGQTMNVKKLSGNMVRVRFWYGRESDYTYLISSDKNTLISEMEDNEWDRSIIPVLYKSVIF